MSFVKLDDRLLTSSLWIEGDAETVVVWVYLLLRADSEGIVYDTLPAIAHGCKLPISRVEEILVTLGEPDPYSRSPEHDGRRISVEREPEYQVVILNHTKYRAKDHTAAERQRRARERKTSRRDTVTSRRDTVTRHAKSQRVTQAEAEADTDTEAEKEKELASAKSTESQPALELKRTSAASALAKGEAPNPFRFVCYWQDADEARDFALRFEPTEGLERFVIQEAVELQIPLSRNDLARLTQQSAKVFVAEYSKRDQRGRTRGRRMNPRRLTEEFVAWLRRDLAYAARSWSSRTRASPALEPRGFEAIRQHAAMSAREREGE